MDGDVVHVMCPQHERTATAAPPEEIMADGWLVSGVLIDLKALLTLYSLLPTSNDVSRRTEQHAARLGLNVRLLPQVKCYLARTVGRSWY